MIVFSCSHCGKTLQVKEALAGKKARCPHCGQPGCIPSAAASTPDSAPLTLPSPDSWSGAAALPNGSDEAAGESGIGNTLSSGFEPELYDFLAPPQAPDELGRLGPYRVLQVLGAGGMGVVFRAQDPQLERAVALKAMLPTLAVSASARQRFLREARAAAAIDHDHIVHIYQVGEDRGVPFLAMQFLKGEPLDERLRRESLLPLTEVVRIGREVADGLAAAHAGGLVHRDIKPGNLWLEGERARVKILDFGLARAVDDKAHLTKSGAIVGTPAYMAPEQAKGLSIDARCDLFSVGSVLYRLCTGELPFQGSDTIATLVAVATENPRPPRELNPEVPPTLADLIMHLLAKEPAERPASAQAVGEALAAIERELPLLPAAPAEIAPPAPKKTRPAAAPGRAKPAASPTARLRSPGMMATQVATETSGRVRRLLPFPRGKVAGVTGLLLLAVGFGVTLVLWQPWAQQATRPPQAVTRNGPPTTALPPEPAKNTGESSSAKLQPHSAPILFVQYSPDGKYLATASKDGTVKLWDAATNQQVRQLTGHTEEVTCVAFSPDSKRLASGSTDKTVRLWDVATGRELNKFLGHHAGVGLVVFSNDGKLLASGGNDFDRGVWLWDLSAKPPGRKLGGLNKGTASLAFSRDDKTLVAGSWMDTIRLWDVATREERRPPITGTFACFTPDGDTLFVGTCPRTATAANTANEGGMVHRFETGTWKEQGEKLQVDLYGVDWMTMSADGKWLAVTGHGSAGLILLVEVTDPRQPAKGKSRTRMGRAITSFSRDGKTLAWCSLWDQEATPVRLLDVSTMKDR